MLKELILKNRSYRRFHQVAEIGLDTLKDLVDLARHSASAGNLQPLKYILSTEKGTNAKIFKYLAWAGYLKDWQGPEEGERPSAYIVLLGDKNISSNFSVDPGIACQSILLGAAEKGLGGCIIGALKKNKLRMALSIEENYEILYVVALGKPKETVMVQYIESDGDIKYWRDDKGVHHVPKRRLEDIIVKTID